MHQLNGGKFIRVQAKDEGSSVKVAGSNGQFAIDNKQKSPSMCRETGKP